MFRWLALPRDRPWRRWIGVVGVALLIVLAALWARQRSGAAAPSIGAPPAVPVTAATAARTDVPNVIETIGTVQSIDLVAVRSQVNGPIVKIEFTPGEEVKKGQELFLIDPRPYQAALDQTQAQLKHDQALLQEAQTDLKRYQTLETENSIARQQAEDQVYLVQQD
jgi:membrane fusion protein, multidrug efflux system